MAADALSNNTVARVFSLRQDFSAAFNRLVNALPGEPSAIDTDKLRDMLLYIEYRLA